MNSIKLSYAQWEAYQREISPFYKKSERPIQAKMEAAGVKTHGTDLYITNAGGYELIVSNGPLENPPPAPKREIISMIEPEVNRTEVMSVFYELLGAWYGEAVCVIENMGDIDEEKEMLDLKKAVYIQRFKLALGAE